MDNVNTFMQDRIKLAYVDTYFDGGTNKFRCIATGKLYYKDGRFRSPTAGQMFDAYPSETANIIDKDLFEFPTLMYVVEKS